MGYFELKMLNKDWQIFFGMMVILVFQPTTSQFTSYDTIKIDSR